MDRYTFETKKWLDLRFDPAAHAAIGIEWRPFSPIFGFPAAGLAANEFLATARLVRLLGQLESLRPLSFLDVGGAEGFVADLVRAAFPSTFVASCDLSIEAARRAREFCRVPSVALDAAALPFDDESFDVVFMSEVLEHLANPVRALLELKRVARTAVIVTTEAFAVDEDKRRRELEERRFKPHMDRSIFCPKDFEVVFADCDRRATNQASRIPAPPPETLDGILRAMAEVTATDDLAWPAHGIVFVAKKRGMLPRPIPVDPARLSTIEHRLTPKQVSAVPGDRSIDPLLAHRLRCPECRGEFAFGERIVCRRCGISFSQIDGCPDLATGPDRGFPRTLVDEARRGGLDDRRIDELVALEKRLVFELDEAVDADILLPKFADRFIAEHATRVRVVDDLIEIEADDDPAILTPRLNRPIDRVATVEIEIAVDEHPEPEYLLQVYFWTLERPFFSEGSCAVARSSADGVFRRIKLEVPRVFPPGDELIRLRIDPCLGRGRARLRAVDVRGERRFNP